MLIKWILLLVIAWYVSKAVGNLFLSIRGPIPQQGPRPINRDEKEGIRVERKPTAEAVSKEKREVEDARFIDL